METAAANQTDPKPTRMSKAPWICVALIALLFLGVVAWRGFDRARKLRWMKACQENLTKIDGRKEQWALENNKTPGTPVTYEDLRVKDNSLAYIKNLPTECPSHRGTYILNPIGVDPVCTSGLPGHTLSEVGDPITALEE